MNLSEIRDTFAALSGRADFSADAAGQARANFFINSGARLLDGLLEKPDQETIKYPLAAGQTMFTIRTLRYAKEVWRKDLVSEKDYRLHLAPNWAVRTGQDPYAYSFAPAGSDPLKRGERPNAWFVPAGDGYSMANLEVAPWTVDSELTVVGYFDNSNMSDDLDTNWWSVVRPELLVKAALYELETFYRNSEGAADWLRAIQLELGGIVSDAAARELTDDNGLGDHHGQLHR